MTKLYLMRRDANGDYKIIKRSSGRVVFYGDRDDCEQWLERNGHDEWN